MADCSNASSSFGIPHRPLKSNMAESFSDMGHVCFLIPDAALASTGSVGSIVAPFLNLIKEQPAQSSPSRPNSDSTHSRRVSHSRKRRGLAQVISRGVSLYNGGTLLRLRDHLLALFLKQYIAPTYLPL